MLMAINDDPRYLGNKENHSLESLMTPAAFDILINNCIDLVPNVEHTENSNAVQTNSAVARGYLGLNLGSEDHSFDKMSLQLKHDKIDFPDASPASPTVSSPLPLL